MSGSVMKEYSPREMKKMRKLYLDLDERGYFHSLENGRSQFTQGCVFDDLNTAAQFLMHRGGENTAAWKQDSAALKEEEIVEEAAVAAAEETNEIKETKPAKKQNAKKKPAKKTPAKRRTASKKTAPKTKPGKTEKRVFRAKKEKPAAAAQGE